MTIHDLTGQRFVRLVVQERCQPPKEGTKKDAWWMCLCDCGNVKAVRASHLKRGGVQSCGCLQRENLSVYPSTHNAPELQLGTLGEGCLIGVAGQRF